CERRTLIIRLLRRNGKALVAATPIYAINGCVHLNRNLTLQNGLRRAISNGPAEACGQRHAKSKRKSSRHRSRNGKRVFGEIRQCVSPKASSIRKETAY